MREREKEEREKGGWKENFTVVVTRVRAVIF